ncbi:MAG: Coenzyme F420 hydrogenase/dehydrogenase, beta subunit C-terminal domain [Armatimonadota bacterium]
MLFGEIPDVSRSPDLGYYQSCFAGHCADERRRLASASGGIATWFLSELLRRGEVDSVACVVPTADQSQRFQFAICHSVEDVEAAARSAYYPVEMSHIIRQMLSVEGRYAIVCLPCLAKALRLACDCIPRLKERVTCIVGLVCGHTVSSFFAEYVGALADSDAGAPQRVTFRTKDPRFPASELGTECVWQRDGSEQLKTVYWSGPMAKAWSEHWFTPRPCLFCDDTFAEAADISLMDAWLPKYIADYRGNNILIVRSRLANEIIQSGLDSGRIFLEPCSVDEVVASQRPVVENKTSGLAYRLWLAQRSGEATPGKRVAPRRQWNPVVAAKWRRYAECSAIGASKWRDSAGFGDFYCMLSKESWLEWIVAAFGQVRKMFRRIARRLKRLVCGRLK